MNTSLETLLRHVVRPARYAGAEWNSRTKQWDSYRIRIALAHPDLYEIGISNPRLASLYALLAEQKDALGERVYAPAPDFIHALRAAGAPLFATESHRPLADFDAILLDLGRELGWTSILGMLDVAGIPLLQKDRAAHPLVIGWAGETTNPEPLADILDCVLLGDAEAILLDLLAALDAARGQGRASILRSLARVEGIYVPSLHPLPRPVDGHAPESSSARRVMPRYAFSLPPAPTRPPVPWIEAVRDRGLLEVQRGAPEGSPAHVAGLAAPPVRRRPPQETEAALTSLVRWTGYEDIDLVGPGFGPQGSEDMLRALLGRFQDMQTAVHLPPLDVQDVTPDLVRTVSSALRPGLTLAPEVLSSARLTALLGGPEGQALCAALAAGRDQLGALRLTFVVGHPKEDEEGWRLAGPYVQMLHRAAGKKTRLRASALAFIPRPNTPYARAALPDPEVLRARLHGLRKAVSRAGGTLNLSDPDMALVEGIIARGDRRMGAALRAAWEAGSYLETWRENFSLDRWRAALAQAGLDMTALSAAVPEDAPLPWDHLFPSYQST